MWLTGPKIHEYTCSTFNHVIPKWHYHSKWGNTIWCMYSIEYYSERIYCNNTAQNVTWNGRNSQYCCLWNMLTCHTKTVNEELSIYWLHWEWPSIDILLTLVTKARKHHFCKSIFFSSFCDNGMESRTSHTLKCNFLLLTYLVHFMVLILRQGLTSSPGWSWTYSVGQGGLLVASLLSRSPE